ncbi:ATP-binding protein [Oscillatoria sp. FACHB-1406]|uniref:ATP-binding protein n=1 Tax=Oscillatoria sp. FACHB-1406 TaxID=2692846 RepID=UPI00168920CE|nr:ATP-binding protein [Oscillatoria sp. FACHB-1406]MBD2576775.1 tetratricopeptide repeat protein [Oscillatoria sp. FACHB-1406]
MPSLQEIIKQRQRTNFVGREEQVNLFGDNLKYSPEDSRRRFIFNVWGQGGVGKSTLLRQFRKIAEEAKLLAAYIDEAESSVPEVMGRFAEQLEEKGQKLAQFSERYKVYRQKKQELEADPDAPQGFSAFVGKSLAKTGMKLGRQVPGAGIALEFVDEEAVATQAGEWASYVAKKLGNKDEVKLVREPEEVLTPLFLKEIGKLAEKNSITLLFDTYERTDSFLDRWLREVLEGRYGEVSSQLLFVIAGREELDENRWADYEGLIARLPLEPFSEEEAEQYLARKGITNRRVIEEILKLSGCLPLLVATLAAESPNDPDKLGDASGTAVERFLKWVEDTKQRQVVLDAALTRCLNRDILAQLHGTEEADKQFDWLKTMPFVQERSRGWAYHDVVRMQMLRYKRLTSPQGWAELHGKLAEYNDKLRQGLELEEKKRQRDETWQRYTLEVLYHRLCQAPQKHLPVALNEFLAALKAQYEFARKWAETMERAGKDAEVTEVQRWGARLTEGLTAYDEDRYEVTVAMFAELLKCSEIQERWQAVALGWRGETYRLMERYEDALKDLDKAIELDPKYDWAIARRGNTYRLMKRYEDALADFNRAIELDPEYKWAIAQRGETYRLMERYEDALADYNRAIELDPELDWALLSLRGVTYQAIKRYDDALADFNHAIELAPEYNWAILQLRGVTYYLIKRYEDALADCNCAIELDPEFKEAIASRGETYKAMERYEDALADYNRAIELDPEYKWAIAQRGQTYRLMKRYEDALADFNCAIELDPEFKEAIKFRGEIYRLMKRYEEALAEFNRAIELDPAYDWAIASRGETYQAMERYEDALTDYNSAIELDPAYDWAIAQRGETYRLMKRYEEALADFNRAIELDPEYKLAISSRGQTYRLMKRYEDALADFNRAIELDPEYQWAIAQRGETYRLMGRYEDALTDFNRAIEFDPEDKWAIASRGETYKAMERYENALTDYNRAIELDPKYDWAIAQRGETHQAMERYEDALADFNRAIELDPEDKWAIAQRGETYRLMKRYEEALADFIRAIELDPEYKWAIARRGETYLMLQRYSEALVDFNHAIQLDSNNDWNLYLRALAYQVLNEPDNARNDLQNAIQLAQQAYNKDPKHWSNTFNLALYFLAADNIEEAKHFYRDALTRGAPPERIKEAIRDLEDFLRIFPQNANAQAARQFLQRALTP